MIGNLRHRGELFRIRRVKKERGGWADGPPEYIGRIWCNIKPLGGQRLLRYQRENNPINTLILARYNPALEERGATFYIRHSGKRYTVQHVVNSDTVGRLIHIEAVDE